MRLPSVVARISCSAIDISYLLLLSSSVVLSVLLMISIAHARKSWWNDSVGRRLYVEAYGGDGLHNLAATLAAGGPPIYLAVAPRPTASSTWSRYRMVVFPALSRPRMRILTSPADVPTDLREGISLGGRWLGKALLRVLQVISFFLLVYVPFGKSASAVASLFPKRDPKIDENRMPMFLASRATRLFRAGGGVDFSMGLKVNPRKAKKSTVLDMFDITQYAIISFSGYSKTIA